jgi:hypothetical protein
MAAATETASSTARFVEHPQRTIIAGEWVELRHGRTLEVHDPALAEVTERGVPRRRPTAGDSRRGQRDLLQPSSAAASNWANETIYGLAAGIWTNDRQRHIE